MYRNGFARVPYGIWRYLKIIHVSKIDRYCLIGCTCTKVFHYKTTSLGTECRTGNKWTICYCNVSASVTFTPSHYNRASHYTNSVSIKIIHLAYNRSQYHHVFVATVGASVYVVSFSIFRTVVMRDALVALWWASFATIQVHVSVILG